MWPRCFVNELMKLKRSGVLLLSTVGTLISNILFTGTALALDSVDTTIIKSVPLQSWATWIGFHYEGIMPMLLPMYLVILCALTVNQEKRFGTWKVLALLPVNPFHIYLSKLVVVIIVFTLSHFIFVAMMWAIPYMAGFSWAFDAFPAKKVWLLFITTICASLGTIALVFMVSYFSRNFIMPLAVGILGFVLSQLFYDNGIQAWYFPFSLPVEGYDLLNVTTNFPVFVCVVSLAFFTILTLAAIPLTRNLYPTD